MVHARTFHVLPSDGHELVAAHEAVGVRERLTRAVRYNGGAVVDTFDLYAEPRASDGERALARNHVSLAPGGRRLVDPQFRWICRVAHGQPAAGRADPRRCVLQHRRNWGTCSGNRAHVPRVWGWANAVRVRIWSNPDARMVGHRCFDAGVHTDEEPMLLLRQTAMTAKSPGRTSGSLTSEVVVATFTRTHTHTPSTNGPRQNNTTPKNKRYAPQRCSFIQQSNNVCIVLTSMVQQCATFDATTRPMQERR